MKIRYSIIKHAAIIILPFVIIPSLMFGFIQTRYGRSIILSMVNNRILNKSGLRIESGEIRGIVPFNITGERIALFDESGLWLEIKDLAFKFSPLKLITGRIIVEKLNAGSAHLERFPVLKETTREKETASFYLPSVLQRVSVLPLSVKRFSLGEELFEEKAAFSVEVQISGNEKKDRNRLYVKFMRTDIKGDFITLDAGLKADDRVYSVDAVMKESGKGLLGKILGIRGPLHVNMKCEGPLNDVRGTLKIDAEKLMELNSNIQMVITNTLSVDMEGSVLIHKDALPANLIQFTGSETLFKLDSELFYREKLLLKNFSIENENTGLDISSDEFTLKFPSQDESPRTLLNITSKGAIRNISLPSAHDSIHETTVLEWKIDADILKDRGFRVNELRADSGDLSFNIHGIYDHTARKGEGDLALYVNRLLADKALISLKAGYKGADGKTISTLAMSLPELDPFADLAGQDISGSANISASLTNSAGIYNLKADLDIDNPATGKISARKITAEIDISGEPNNSAGTITFLINDREYDIKGSSRFSYMNNTFNFRDIRFQGDKLLVEGNMSANPADKVTNLQLQFMSEDLSLLNTLLDGTVTGSASGSVKLVSEDNKIKGTLELDTQDITSPFGSLAGLSARSSFSGDISDPKISMDVSANDFKNQGTRLDWIRFTGKGNLKKSQFGLDLSGNAVKEFDISLKGHHLLSDTNQSLSITELTGRIMHNPVRLPKPLKINREDNIIHLEKFELSLAGGSLRGSGKISPDSTGLEFFISSIPLNSLLFAETSDMDGMLEGTLRVGGQRDLPQLESRIDITGIRFHKSMSEKLPSLNLTLESDFKDRMLQSSFSLTGSAEYSMNGTLDIPLDLSIKPFLAGINRDEEIGGKISGKSDLAFLSDALELHDQQFSGSMDMNFDIKGSLNRPEITGHTDVSRGFYENIRTGTVLRDMELSLVSESEEIRVRHFRANDGRSGEITGNGRISLIPEKFLPYSVDFQLNQASLYNTANIALTLNGQITLSGDLNNHSLEGGIDIERGDIRIPEHLSPEITGVEVIEINRTNADNEPVNKKSAPKPLVYLNLQLESTGRIYVNGRGLASEWRGDLGITGTDSEPVITGDLNLLRGSYTFLGKRFDLTKGFIGFDGRNPPSPDILISGRIRNDDITAIIDISGNINSPEIALSSIPTLPPDEILSRILFRRNISQITPLQAIQLGNAINGMLGNRSFDLMEKTRKMLGVDQLEIRQSEENMDESILSAGKYLNENIYLEVEKGIGPDSGKAVLKWEISPNISVETEVGEGTETGAGINWRLDY